MDTVDPSPGSVGRAPLPAALRGALPTVSIADPAAAVSPVVIVPTYNNARHIGGVLEALRPLGLAIIVVNDGSTDGTGAVLRAWGECNPGADFTVLEHGRNRGKAAALRSGFGEAAARPGVTHAVTIDADGQLDATDIPRLLDECAARPRALVLGRRPAVMEACPGRCAVGRRFASLAVLAQTGLRLGDTQCGLRAYPLGLLRAVRCRAARYAFEAEIITRAAWAGFEVVETPVSCRYLPAGERVSHFRPVVDSLRQGGVHVGLALRALVPFRHAPAAARPAPTRTWRRLGAWLNPLACWRTVRSSELGRLELATAMGVGAWIGTLPFFGLHTAMSLYVAWRLHLHPAPTVLGSQVSTPPLGVALAAASVWVGSVLMTGHGPRAGAQAWSAASLPATAWAFAPAWMLGSVVVGLGVGLCVFAATLAATGCVRPAAPNPAP